MKSKTICFCIPVGRKQKDHQEKLQDDQSHSSSRQSRKSRGHDRVATAPGSQFDGGTTTTTASNDAGAAAVLMTAGHMSTMEGGDGGSAHGGGDGG